MAPLRVLLLLAAAAAVFSPDVVIHAARDDPPSRDHVVPVPAAAETSGVQVGVAPHLIHPAILADDPAVQRTVYDVTVIFRATARLGPPRLQYYVVPADAAAPNSGGADREIDGVDLFLLLMGLFMGAIIGASAMVGFGHKGRRLGEDKDESSGDDAAFQFKNPEAARAQAGAAKAARGGY